MSSEKHPIIFKILLSAIFIMVFSSCQNSGEERELTFNAYSDRGRTNNYEYVDNFYKTMHFTDKTEARDSSGFSGIPLVLTEDSYCVGTNNSNIGLFSLYNCKWLFPLDSNSVVASAMCADPKLNVYFVSNTGVIYSVSYTGEFRWKYELPLPDKDIIVFSDLLAVKDGIIVAASCGIVEKINFEGERQWRYESGLSPSITFAGDRQGRLYVPFSNNRFGITDSLVCLDTSGKQLWSVPLESTRIIKTPAVNRDRIYVGGQKDTAGTRISTITALDHKGNIIWDKELEIVPRNISLDNEGNIYVSGFNTWLSEPLSAILSFDKEGKSRWERFFEHQITGPCLISSEEIAFFGRDRKTRGMYFLNHEGRFWKVISMSDAPIFIEHPVTTPGGLILFSCIYESSFIRIDETAIDKILPY